MSLGKDVVLEYLLATHRERPYEKLYTMIFEPTRFDNPEQISLAVFDDGWPYFCVLEIDGDSIYRVVHSFQLFLITRLNNPQWQQHLHEYIEHVPENIYNIPLPMMY